MNYMRIFDSGFLLKLFAFLLLIYMLLCFVVPFFNTPGTLVELDGKPGLIDYWGIWSALDPVSALTYLSGDFLCHQMESRTLILNGNQMPLCIRDVSILSGLGVTMMVLGFFDKYAEWGNKKLFVVSGIAIFLTVISWSLEHYGIFQSLAFLVLAGIFTGAGIAVLIATYTKYILEKV